MFKLFFSKEENEKFLKDFLESITGNEISILEFSSDVEVPKETVLQKGCRLDIFGEINKTTLVNIEMQDKKQKDILSRTFYYAVGIFKSQLKKGENYGNLKNVLLITIANFVAFKDDDCFISEIHPVRETANGEISELKEPLLTQIFIELPKFRKAKKDMNNKLHQWLVFFDDQERSLVDMAIQNNVLLQEADEEIKRLSKNKRLLEIFDRTDIWEFEEAAKKNEIIKDTIKERDKEIILNSIKTGFSNEQIALITGLKEQEIEKIRKRYLSKLKKKK